MMYSHRTCRSRNIRIPPFIRRWLIPIRHWKPPITYSNLLDDPCDYCSRGAMQARSGARGTSVGGNDYGRGSRAAADGTNGVHDGLTGQEHAAVAELQAPRLARIVGICTGRPVVLL